MSEQQAETPGRARRVWDVLYGIGYGHLRALVQILFRPLFRIRSVEREPALPAGPLIVCANHASYLDPAFVQVAVRRRVIFMMTNDFYEPIWGRWFFRLVGAIPVGSGRLAREGLERAVRHLRQGRAIGIFPEGRLSPDGDLTPAQRGVAVLARLGGAPVLPLGIYGNRQAWPKGAAWMTRADVRVAYGDLLPPPGPKDVAARAQEQAYAERIMDEVRRARERARRTGRGRAP